MTHGPVYSDTSGKNTYQRRINTFKIETNLSNNYNNCKAGIVEVSKRDAQALLVKFKQLLQVHTFAYGWSQVETFTTTIKYNKA